MNLGLPISTLFAFLLVLFRITGLLLFLPFPALRSAPRPAKLILAVALTVMLFPLWPNLANEIPTIGELLRWALAEAGFGLTIGLSVSLLLAAFQLAMQIVGLQAGYGYSMTIDPASQADSSVLQLGFALFTALLIFVTGIDRELIRILADTLRAYPPGQWTPSAATLDAVIELGSIMCTTAVRIAFPLAALLLLIDIALALLGRMQQQLQLISLAFPIKMLLAIVVLAMMAPVFPRIFARLAASMTANLHTALGI